ncbi:macro domain-containing protein [[Eubacterium] cellulosolvens]
MFDDYGDINKFKIYNRSINVVQGDITEMETDALVNAANNRLMMGAGVAGALKRKGGTIIEAEAIKMGPIPIGEAVMTTAGNLKAKFVIHAAGMGTDLHTDAERIKSATYNALKRAHEAKLKSISFPSIGTGVGNFPMRVAAEIMMQTVAEFLRNEPNTSIEEIFFVLYTGDAYHTFAGELRKLELQVRE